MPIPFLFLPPQGEKTRDWARRLGEAVPELEIIAPETMEGAEQAIAMAEGAYGTIPPNLLGARREICAGCRRRRRRRRPGTITPS